MARAHVKALYFENDKIATGKCAVLINDKKRACCPYLAAATKYPTNHFTSIWE